MGECNKCGEDLFLGDTHICRPTEESIRHAIRTLDAAKVPTKGLKILWDLKAGRRFKSMDGGEWIEAGEEF
jgi:hypothetical protein